MIEEEAKPERSDAIIPGAPLDDLSLEGLQEQIEILRGEIARAEAMAEKKRAGRQAADAIFKL